MTKSEELTDILTRLYSNEVVRAVENDPCQEAIDEALLMGLIYRAWNIYLLTKKGFSLMKENKTYNDFLNEIEPVRAKKNFIPLEINFTSGVISGRSSTNMWLVVLVECLLASLLLFIIFKM